MKIIVIDSQGGGIGRAIIDKLKAELSSTEIIAIGTNAGATANMLKGGADAAATGENAVLYNTRMLSSNDIIIGPMGIISANSMYGEISPAIAHAVSESEANTLLIPVSKCRIHIAGNREKPLSSYIDDAVSFIKQMG